MDESINTANKKQIRRKPPLSPVRIIGEILVGMAAGIAVAVPALYVIGASFPKGCFSGFAALGYMFLVIPPLYGIVSAVGVYLVGSIGKQTGSFLPTLGCGLLAGFIALIILYVSLRLQTILTMARSSSVMMVGFIVELQKIFRCVCWVIVLLIPPILATLGFNLTRRYKKPPSS